MIKIDLGRVVATKRVWELIDTNERFNRFVSGCLTRFTMNDWGDLNQEDWEINDNFVKKNGGRILGSYKLPEFAKVDSEEELLIILDKNESVTTILFPGDY